MEKVTKNNLTIISKPHAHLHTMTKTHAEFQNDRYKQGGTQKVGRRGGGGGGGGALTAEGMYRAAERGRV